jgi:hypothetical protein
MRGTGPWLRHRVLREERPYPRTDGLTGLHQNRLSDYKTGKHRPKEYSVFAAFADGLS